MALAHISHGATGVLSTSHLVLVEVGGCSAQALSQYGLDRAAIIVPVVVINAIGIYAIVAFLLQTFKSVLAVLLKLDALVSLYERISAFYARPIAPAPPAGPIAAAVPSAPAPPTGPIAPSAPTTPTGPIAPSAPASSGKVIVSKNVFQSKVYHTHRCRMLQTFASQTLELDLCEVCKRQQ